MGFLSLGLTSGKGKRVEEKNVKIERASESDSEFKETKVSPFPSLEECDPEWDLTIIF